MGVSSGILALVSPSGIGFLIHRTQAGGLTIIYFLMLVQTVPDRHKVDY
ncbi:hypothetical protein Mpal_2119 [Methanosphaerula palustris E1-9c]|uniref:Uncharacterized protein n=1 Tax=Methanosphaerula palustris (strain ATCC BAA-1556 / DSM 19958 / E1-9c) TaxID=521011 RepID=B8GDR6_METPE|nr:hypothetical protein Mpal_2119 [Methanosphaerula palustris E1-9c]